MVNIATLGRTLLYKAIHGQHTVDIFHDGIVHLSGGGIVIPHFAGDALVHEHHGKDAEGQR